MSSINGAIAPVGLSARPAATADHRAATAVGIGGAALTAVAAVGARLLGASAGISIVVGLSGLAATVAGVRALSREPRAAPRAPVADAVPHSLPAPMPVPAPEIVVTPAPPPVVDAAPATSTAPAVTAPGSPTTAVAGGGAIATEYEQLTETTAVDAHDSTDPASFATRHQTTGPGWLSADMGFGLRLPDGRVAWFYGDTVTGTASAEGILEHGTGFLRNSVVIQDGTTLTTLARRATDGTLHGTIEPEGHPGEWYWPGAPVVDGDHIRLVVGRLRTTDADTPGWNFASTGYDIATLSARDLSVESVEPLTQSTDISWGGGSLNEGDHTILVGQSGEGFERHVVLGRIPRIDTGSAPTLEVWDGSGWTTDESAAAVVTDLIGTQIMRTKHGYALIGQDGIFSPTIVVRTAREITGPWSEPRKIGEVPHTGTDEIFYTPTLHPEFTTDGQMLISTSVNADDGTIPNDLSGYRPRFISVPVSALEPR